MANYGEKQRQAAEAAEKQREKDRALVAPLSVRAGVQELIERAHPTKDRAADVMRWPGCEAGWPELDEDRRCMALDAALPPEGGVERPDWTPLWRAVGPPRPDWLAVLVGPTGRGKTAWGVQVAEGAAAGGSPVLYLSVELGRAELAARLLALRARTAVSWGAFLRGGVNEPGMRHAGEALVADCPGLYLWAPSPKDRNVGKLREVARAVSRVHDNRPPLIVIDYLQRMKATGQKDRRLEVAELSGELRALSRPGGGWPGAAVIVLSSTARGGYEKVKDRGALLEAFEKNPDDLVGLGKESGEIEYDASLLLVLTCDPRKEGEEERPGALAAPKVRQGRSSAFELAFSGARGWWGGMTSSRAPKGATKTGAQTPKDKGSKDGGGSWVD